jgi:hypothetical protein
MRRFILVIVLCAVGVLSVRSQDQHLLTRWAADVTPDNVLPEYPRPQLVREQWLNLNGLWDYAITNRTAAQPTEWQGEILVPFPIESVLSGVHERLTVRPIWYRRTFTVPECCILGPWIGSRQCG